MNARTATADLMARLRRHYIDPDQPTPGGLFLTETGWNGADHATRADALYVGFTSTRGRLLVGHEVKVSRADWRRELAHAGKADPWHDQCHAWYVVAPSTDVVPADEVPDGWGLLVPNPRTDRRLKTVVKAHVHTDRVPSWEAARSLLARADTLARTEAAHIRRDAHAEAHTRHRDLVETLRAERRTDADTARLRLLDELEEHLGVTLSPFGHSVDPTRPTSAQVAAALTLLQAPDRLINPRALTHIQAQLTGALDHLAALRDALATLTPDPRSSDREPDA